MDNVLLTQEIAIRTFAEHQLDRGGTGVRQTYKDVLQLLSTIGILRTELITALLQIQQCPCQTCPHNSINAEENNYGQ